MRVGGGYSQIRDAWAESTGSIDTARCDLTMEELFGGVGHMEVCSEEEYIDTIYDELRREKRAEYARNHRERQRAYYQTHKSRLGEKMAQYRQEHRAELRAMARKYYYEHKAEIQERRAKYYREHAEAIKEKESQRYRRVKEAKKYLQNGDKN